MLPPMSDAPYGVVVPVYAPTSVRLPGPPGEKFAWFGSAVGLLAVGAVLLLVGYWKYEFVAGV